MRLIDGPTPAARSRRTAESTPKNEIAGRFVVAAVLGLTATLVTACSSQREATDATPVEITASAPPPTAAPTTPPTAHTPGPGGPPDRPAAPPDRLETADVWLEEPDRDLEVDDEEDAAAFLVDEAPPDLVAEDFVMETGDRGRMRETMDRTDVPREAAEEDGDDGPFTTVEVYYGTDREWTDASDLEDRYTGGRSTRGLQFGTCEVTIPRTHRPGHLEEPNWVDRWFRGGADPARHVVLQRIDRLGEEPFFTAVNEELAQAPSRQAFVFVHGFNVSFAEAARRTAQIAYDLRFPGVPMFYSWPSEGETKKYLEDETNVLWTEPHLKTFLVAVANRTHADRIHLIAHSMGSRALSGALKEIALTSSPVQFTEVILAAPDIDADVFLRDLAPRMREVCDRLTLYASSDDKALQFSKTLHGYPRAGESGAGLVVSDLMDTIDATGIDTSLLGHSYFAQVEAVLRDLSLLLEASYEPPSRGLVDRPHRTRPYWAFP